MNPREKKYLILGIISTILISTFIILTFLFSDYLLKYSGIITFYSLLVIIITFAFTEYFKKRSIDKENYDLLRDILHISNLIRDDLDYYITNLGQGVIPPTSMGSFDFDILPPEINSISTRPISKIIVFINSKIDTINDWKEGYLEILFEPDVRLRNKMLFRFNQVWGNNAQIAINELKNSLDRLKSEIAKWIKVDI